MAGGSLGRPGLSCVGIASAIKSMYASGEPVADFFKGEAKNHVTLSTGAYIVSPMDPILSIILDDTKILDHVGYDVMIS